MKSKNTITLINPFSKIAVDVKYSHIIDNMDCIPWDSEICNMIDGDTNEQWIDAYVDKAGLEQASAIIIGS